jgi:hypothetical protein
MICWRCKKQKSVATAMCEAYYMVLTLATKQWMWLIHILEEYNLPITNATVYSDNRASLDIADKHTNNAYLERPEYTTTNDNTN